MHKVLTPQRAKVATEYLMGKCSFLIFYCQRFQQLPRIFTFINIQTSYFISWHCRCKEQFLFEHILTCVCLPRIKKTWVTPTLIGANTIRTVGIDTTVGQGCHKIPVYKTRRSILGSVCPTKLAQRPERNLRKRERPKRDLRAT